MPPPAPSRSSCFSLCPDLWGSSSPATALTASATVRDANSIQLGDVTYRLDGVDAPELDQVCIDDHADPWTCGIDARDQLTKLIGGTPVRCDDVGPEKNFGKRHRAICTVEGDKVSLNEQLIKLGFAIAREPIKATSSRPGRRQGRSPGIWKGCFVAPQEFRTARRTAPCSAPPAAPTATRRFARCCFRRS